MSEELRRLKAQQDALAAQLHRTQMQLQAQQARREEPEIIEEDPPMHYQQVPHNEAMIQAIAQQAADRAAQAAQANIHAEQQVQTSIKNRMSKLVADFPAIQDEDSALTIKARDAYARLSKDKPHLDEATKYEMAVLEAATQLGARPINAPVEDLEGDFLMPTGHNPALPKKSSSKKNFLTPNVIKNAMALGINVDPNTPEGKKNLAELNENSEHFKAYLDEGHLKYR